MLRNPSKNGFIQIIFCIILIYCLSINAVIAVEYYVDINNGSDVGDGMTPDTAIRTITGALGNLAPSLIDGDVLYVAQGKYNGNVGETFPIIIPHGISLIGAGADKTFIEGVAAESVISANVLTDVSGYTVKGFTISRGLHGIYVAADAPIVGVIGGPVITENIIVDCEKGIHVQNVSIPINRNVIMINNGDGIYLENSSSGIGSNVIRQNNGYGVYCSADINLEPFIIHNTIVGNYKGIGMDCPIISYILNNIIYKNTFYGIEEISLATDPIVMNNCIKGNEGGDYLDEPTGTGAPEGDIYYGEAMINNLVDNGANRVFRNISKLPRLSKNIKMHLLGSSPCIGSAYILNPEGVIPRVNYDIDGDYISETEPTDIGADQSTGPRLVSAVYFDTNRNEITDQGDRILLQFDQRIDFKGTANPTYFYLGVAGDSLGTTGFAINLNTDNESQLVLTLGLSPTLNINGIYEPYLFTQDSPSGIDLSTFLPPNTIVNKYGVDVVNLEDPLLNDSGVDIAAPFDPITLPIDPTVGATFEINDPNSYYRKHKLIIPENSIISPLKAPLSITMGPADDPHGVPSSILIGLSEYIQFDPNNPAYLVLEYKPEDLQYEEGYIDKCLRIHKWNGSEWEIVPEVVGSQVYDDVNQVVFVPILSLGDDVVKGIKAGDNELYGNVGLATIGQASKTMQPEKLNSDNNTKAGVTITVLPFGAVYTKHSLYIPDYQEVSSGLTITLKQADEDEKHDWENNAILKITSTTEPSSEETLTMEYKDDADPYYDSDLNGGAESDMRIHRWDEAQGKWLVVSESQTVNTTTNTVSSTLPDGLTESEIYAVGIPQEEEPPSYIDIQNWMLY